ncbi:MAG: hypothetical protein ACFCD0_04480 [Gemmataceae bacterium]
MTFSQSVACVLLVIGVGLASNAFTFGQENTTDLGKNAALKYWMAFAVMPELDTQDRKLLSTPSKVAVNKHTRALVKKAKTSLTLLHRGASIQPCNWGYELREGTNWLLPHIGRARDLARLATLRARVRLKDGDVQGGTDDLLAAMKLAHHVGKGGLLIEILVEWGLRHIALKTAAADLAAMTPAQRKQLAANLQKLPPLPKTVTGTRMEKKAGYRSITYLLRAGKFEQVFGYMTNPERGEKYIRAVNAVAKALKNPATQKKAITEFEAIYDRTIQNAALPHFQSVKKLKALQDELQNKREKLLQNPKANATDYLACELTPRVLQIKISEASARIYQKMMLAAIAYANDGAEAASKIVDPITGKAFKITPIKGKSGWIELRSTITYLHGEPMLLEVRWK